MHLSRIGLAFLLLLKGYSAFSQSFLHENGEKMLIGKIERTHLETDSQFSWFNKTYADYKPDEKKIKKLKSAAKAARVNIYLGTWCDDTRILLPRFFKVADMMGIPRENISLYALSRDKKNEGNFTIADVDRVPYFTFYHKGLETGKIIESAPGTIEDVLLNIYKPFLQ